MNGDGRRWDWVWDALLALQVALGVALSGALLWRSPAAVQRSEGWRVAPAPAGPRMAPEVDGPLSLWVHAGGEKYLWAPPGQPLHSLIWARLRRALAAAGAPLYAAPGGPGAAPPALVADLPARLAAAQWLALWGWRSDAAGNVARTVQAAWTELPVDRIWVTLDPPGALVLQGPEGQVAFALSEAERLGLQALLQAALVDVHPDSRPLSQPLPAGTGPGQAAGAGDSAGGAREAGGKAGGAGGGAAPAPGEGSAGTVAAPGAGGLTLVPAQPLAPLVGVMPEHPDSHQVQALVAQFFPDVTVVRQIQEQEATVYTDGHRALRLYQSGALEFNQPQDPGDMAPDLPGAVRAVREFLGPRGLLPPGGVLTGFWQGGGEAHLTFTGRRVQLPLVGPRPWLEVRVAGSHVVYLYRAPDLVLTRSRLLTLPAPEAAVAALQTALGRPVAIRAMHLVHRWDGGSQLLPTWRMELTTGGEYLLDAAALVLVP